MAFSGFIFRVFGVFFRLFFRLYFGYIFAVFGSVFVRFWLVFVRFWLDSVRHGGRVLHGGRVVPYCPLWGVVAVGVVLCAVLRLLGGGRGQSASVGGCCRRGAACGHSAPTVDGCQRGGVAAVQGCGVT